MFYIHVHRKYTRLSQHLTKIYPFIRKCKKYPAPENLKSHPNIYLFHLN
jgi:hypothetical protein